MPHSRRLSGRTLARCQALQIVFQAEGSGRSVDDVLGGDYVLSEGPLDPYAERLARGVGGHLAELDRVLAHSSRNWSLSRMSKVDRDLLRIALYELLYVDEVDTGVSISECVELAKAFGSSDESSRFVNGVLGTIATKIAAGVDVVAQARDLDAAEAAAGEAARAEAAAGEASRAAGENDDVPAYGASVDATAGDASDGYADGPSAWDER